MGGAVVEDDKTPIRFAAVLATRLYEGKPVQFGVSAFTDSFGFFPIDGLEHGSCLLPAQRSPARAAISCPRSDLLPAQRSPARTAIS